MKPMKNLKDAIGNQTHELLASTNSGAMFVEELNIP
jgi:hypothetical protein